VIVLGILFTALVILGAALAVQRGRLRSVRARPAPLTVLQRLVALAMLALSNAELVAALVQRPLILPADLRSHAMVAREIAQGRVHDGWVDVYHGGFPLGPHYPSLGWLISAGLMRLGLSPQAAVVIVGVGSVLLFHWLVFRLSMRAGASFGAALTGMAILSWMIPITGFLGGAKAILVIGLLSQVVVMPFVAWNVYATLFGKSERGLVASAVLAMLAHPQVAVGTALLVGVASLFGSRVPRRRWLVGCAAQVIVGAFVFGPGVASLHVPFGWPPMDLTPPAPTTQSWLVRGRPTEMFLGWLSEGDLLDHARLPVVTTVLACAVVVLVATLRRRESRAALVTAGVALTGCISGATLGGLGRVGTFALSFLQPMRMYALLPGVGAVVVVVAVGVVESYVRSLAPGRRGLRRLLVALPSALVLVWIARVAVPPALTQCRARQEFLSTGPCAASMSPGFDVAALERTMGTLSNGRLYYANADLRECAATTDLDFASSIPIGWPFVAGAHVGVLMYAFDKMHPDQAGGDARADVLGVGTVLHRSTDRPLPDGAWRETTRVGDVIVSERVGGASFFGVGCATQAWRGTDQALRDALFVAMEKTDPVLATPGTFILLEPAASPVALRETRGADCDASRAEIVASRRVGPGSYEADVRAEAPVDLVLKETAYPTWSFEVDGVRTPFRLVAPGFMVLHLPAGTHHVTATTRLDVAYVVSVWASLLAAVGLSWLARRKRWLRLRGR
jgi:hypothetical protein